MKASAYALAADVGMYQKLGAKGKIAQMVSVLVSEVGGQLHLHNDTD